MDSFLLEFSMFPSDVGESKSTYVSQVVKTIKESGISYQLTPMATIIECNSLREAFDLVEKCYYVLENMGCNRVYSVLKFDIRKNSTNRLQTKIQSVEEKIGKVSR
ncbi:MAG: MTH1187 family thiamine-binding protein [Campylobacterales bacterium]|nr:MTH1187 family thiamine-binding protein [Campylobacterales bacterium]